ncbi:MAG: cobalamin biosynthesis protein CobW [Oscillospiraceae bacterium]|jgi:G3E family GTPase|nr:cobalamin biosynthesis protein CobW [Oscillospiraceae bacterium]
MSANMYIVSGFLGAGKTTLIRKLIDEAFGGERVVLVENDFGEVSVDAALMRAGGVEVAELASGCICCSISDDFVKSLRELLVRYKPDNVIIEPSGVGKLSDITASCSDGSIRALAGLRGAITVVDAVRCNMYAENFGEFFEDQIANANAVVLSRCDGSPDASGAARALVRTLNGRAPIFAEPWPALTSASILAPLRGGHEHKQHEHGGGEHVHDAEDVFESVTVYSPARFNESELRLKVAELELAGTLLRAKGLLRGRDGFWDLQYVPGDLKITRCGGGARDGGVLCAMGRGLDPERIAELFAGSLEAG